MDIICSPCKSKTFHPNFIIARTVHYAQSFVELYKSTLCLLNRVIHVYCLRFLYNSRNYRRLFRSGRPGHFRSTVNNTENNWLCCRKYFLDNKQTSDWEISLLVNRSAYKRSIYYYYYYDCVVYESRQLTTILFYSIYPFIYMLYLLTIERNLFSVVHTSG